MTRGRSSVTAYRLLGYAGIRQVLPGCHSRRRPETHRRGQRLQTEARSAKNAPESAICGVLRKRLAPTGSVLWLAPISSPRKCASHERWINLRSDFPFQLSAFPISAFVSAFRPPVSSFSVSVFQLLASWPVEQRALGLVLAGGDLDIPTNELEPQRS